MIYIGVLDTANLDPADDDIIKKTPDGVKKKVENTKCEREKRLRAGAYILLEEVYGRFAKILGIYEKMPRIFYTGEGKPCFENANNNLRAPLVFNLSHNGNLAAVALSDGNLPVGVDIQTLPKGRIRLEKIAERFFAPLRRLDPLFSRGEAIGENTSLPDKMEVNYFYFQVKDGLLHEIPEEKFCPAEISRSEAHGDFLAKWTLLEAVLKASGGGFGEFSSAEGLISSVRAKTIMLENGGSKYALTVAEAKTSD